MIVAALRDLQWRRRRFATAMAGTALVFGMTLLMTGVSHGFDAEAHATARDLRVDTWVVKTGAAGPFLGASPMAQAQVADIQEVPGVEAVSPTLFTRKSVRSESGTDTDVNIFGSTVGGVGVPSPDRGRAPAADGEVLMSSRLTGYHIGDTIELAGYPLRVVGIVDGSTALAGTPNLFLTLGDVQKIAFGGQPVASAFAVRGTPQALPKGYAAITPTQAADDLLRAIEKARSSLVLVSVLLWIVAASIIGAVVYLSALERQRDFAVFKATGVATRSILGGMVLQAALLSVVAALIGSVIATLLGPRFPMIVSLQLRAHLLLPFLATAIGLLASLAGMRRVVAVDPALAFGGP
jgi:putative ABC transport system permease protein